MFDTKINGTLKFEYLKAATLAYSTIKSLGKADFRAIYIFKAGYPF